MDSPLLRHLFSRALRASLASSLMLAGCAPDLSGYSTPVCEGLSFAVSGLSPAVPVDFVQLRAFSTSLDGASSSEGVVSSSGTACATASDKVACESALSQLSSRSGFRSNCNELRCGALYVATTRGDEVVAHTSLEAFKDFLGPIDTPQEAVLVAYASNHDLRCHELPRGAVQTIEGGGYTVTANLNYPCAEVVQFVLEVSVSGEVKELRRYVLHPGHSGCQEAAGPARVSGF